MLDPQFVGYPRNVGFQFLAQHPIARYRPLFVAGENGSRIWAVAASCVQATGLILGVGKLIHTPATDWGGGAIVDGGASDDTMTRVSGSFITDGYLVGQRIQIIGAPTITNDCQPYIKTLAAGTLSFATATVGTSETLGDAAKIYRIQSIGGPAVAANSGYAAGTTSASCINATTMTMVIGATTMLDRYITLGAGDILFGYPTVVMAAATVSLDVTVFGFDY